MRPPRSRQRRATVWFLSVAALCTGLLVSPAQAAPAPGSTVPLGVPTGGGSLSLPLASGPPGATPTGCDPADNPRQNTSGTFCINGSELASRGYNRCLTEQVPLSPNVYSRNRCYGQSSTNDYVESIAQARLVQRLDTQWQSGDTISQRIQWETRIGGSALQSLTGLTYSDIEAQLGSLDYFKGKFNGTVPGMRVDVLTVGGDHNSPKSNPVGILEVKLQTNGGEPAAAAQAAAYSAALRLAGWANTAPGDVSTYRDTFHVSRQCPDGTCQAR